ncbi:MAG: bifunctional diguanylate cyclase/phosphodiesterase [Ilumatobacteraceae bacterium]
MNEALGHSAGDDVLRTIAGRLRLAAGAHGIVGRLGGDELLLALPLPPPDVDDASDAVERRARTVAEAIAHPMDVGGDPTVITASVGVALGPQHGRDPFELLRTAGVALQKAKTNGRNRIEVFDDGLSAEIAPRLRDEQLLRRAIDRSDVEPYYQPLVDATTGRVVGAELLCRWHRDGRAVPAGAFIALAEETGLIDSLSERMIERGLADLRAWERSGVLGSEFRLSMNLPPRPVSPSGRFGRLATLLNTEPLHRLCLEVTETAIIDDVDVAVARLDAALGAQISLDDFGTGNASAQPAADDAARPREAGPQLRGRSGDEPAGSSAGRRLRRARTPPGARHRGRGDRNDRAGRAPHRTRLPHPPGLALRTGAAGPGLRRSDAAGVRPAAGPADRNRLTAPRR